MSPGLIEEVIPGDASVTSELRQIFLIALATTFILVFIRLSGLAKLGVVGDFVQETVTPAYRFYRDSLRLLNRCTKPSKHEFVQMCKATGIGFLLMGSIGFLVKLIHIPINNIIVS